MSTPIYQLDQSGDRIKDILNSLDSLLIIENFGKFIAIDENGFLYTIQKEDIIPSSIIYDGGGV